MSNERDLDPIAIELAARAVAMNHYSKRFGKAVDDEHVKMNAAASWHLFVPDAEIAITAYLVLKEQS